MCGRYVLKASGLELMRELNLEHEPVLQPRYNLAPMQDAPVVLGARPGELGLARWGLLPHWAKDRQVAATMINARVETLHDKAVFASLLPAHRCLVPCDGFYEWKREGRVKVPHYIHPPAPGVMTMAGLWTTWSGEGAGPVTSFTIITTAATGPTATLHDRMPLFIAAADRHRWLTATSVAEVKPLLAPGLAPELVLLAVEPTVNSVSRDDPSCLEPARTLQLSLW